MKVRWIKFGTNYYQNVHFIDFFKHFSTFLCAYLFFFISVWFCFFFLPIHFTLCSVPLQKFDCDYGCLNRCAINNNCLNTFKWGWWNCRHSGKYQGNKQSYSLEFYIIVWEIKLLDLSLRYVPKLVLGTGNRDEWDSQSPCSHKTLNQVD